MQIVFVDFRKAFDLVDHAAALSKLASMVVSRSFCNIDTELPVREVTTSNFFGWGLSKPRGVFQEVPQAFDLVDHATSLSKLACMVVSTRCGK